MKNKIGSLIKKYAEVYKTFEELQTPDGLLPGGDQKTGVIAEYYARCFIEYTRKDLKDVNYAKSGDAYDIKYTLKNGKSVKVQVKGVSEHSKTRTIAPLNLKNGANKKAFDELFLVALDKNFYPKGLYINSYDEIIRRMEQKRDRIVGSKMKVSNKDAGSRIYDFSDNKNALLLKALK